MQTKNIILEKRRIVRSEILGYRQIDGWGAKEMLLYLA
jgi:hypothetical protein